MASLPPEFQDTGNQFARAGFGYVPASENAAGEENFVRVRVDQGLADVAASLQQRDQAFGESGVAK